MFRLCGAASPLRHYQCERHFAITKSKNFPPSPDPSHTCFICLCLNSELPFPVGNVMGLASWGIWSPPHTLRSSDAHHGISRKKYPKSQPHHHSYLPQLQPLTLSKFLPPAPGKSPTVSYTYLRNHTSSPDSPHCISSKMSFVLVDLGWWCQRFRSQTDVTRWSPFFYAPRTPSWMGARR